MFRSKIDHIFENALYADVYYKDAWGHERKFYGRVDRLTHEYFIMTDNHGHSRTIYYNAVQSIDY